MNCFYPRFQWPRWAYSFQWVQSPYIRGSMETPPRNATAHTAALVACQIFRSTSKPTHTSRGVRSVSPLPSKNNTATCLFIAADILPHQKYSKEEKKVVVVETSVESPQGNRRRPSFRHWAATKRAAGTFFILRYSQVCVCVWLQCFNSANKQTKKNSANSFLRVFKCTGSFANAPKERDYFCGWIG